MSAERKLLETYNQTLVKISSAKTAERGSGLNELKQLLSKGKIAGHLDDKGFLKMYETIFRACDADKTPLNKQSKPAITRFSTCGSVLRAAVELGVKRLKIKTVQAVYRHILDIFPVGHTLGGPLSVDYFKALRVLFQYAPHTEHLPSENWEELANFCCAQVQSQLGLPDTDQDDDMEMREMVEVEDRNPRGRVPMLVHEDSNSSRGSASGSGPRLPATVRLSHESEELLECLRYLLASPNAPVQANAKPVCNTLLGFFRSQPTETRAHQHVFSSLNYVLNVATTNDLALVYRVSEAILPVICRLWDTRTSGLKDEMIISLIYCQPHIRARIRSSEGSALRKSVEDLFDTLWSEYISRADREMLQLDDLSFPSVIDEPAIMAPLSIRAISLRTNMQNPRAEQTWMIPNLLASLVEMLDVSSDYSRRTPENSESDGTRKRQRLYRESSEIMRFVRSNNIPRKLLALQVVSFLADLKGIDEEEFPSIMQDFQEACSDDNSAITGWALIAMGSCAFLKCASHPSHSKLWIQVWQLCARYATSPATCRVACHIMWILISRDLVAYPSIANDVDSILQSIGVNGPAILCDSSLALWSLILAKRNAVVQSTIFDPGECLFQWFSSKWRPVQDGLEKPQNIITRSVNTLNATVPDIINFLSVCCGMDPLRSGTYSQFVCGSIGQACLRRTQYHGLRSMLLNDEEEVDDVRTIVTASTAAIETKDPASGLLAKIVDFLNHETGQMHEKWLSLPRQKQGTSMQNVVVFTLVSSIFSSKVSGPALSCARELDQKLQETLIVDLIRFLSSNECSQKHIDGLLSAMHGLLPKASEILSPTGEFGDNFRGATGIFVTHIAAKLEDRERAANSFNDSEPKDAMDIDDDGFGIPSDGHNEEKTNSGSLREEVEVLCSEESFRASISTLIALCSLALKDADKPDICGQFVEYLQRAKKTRLMMIRPVIQDFLFTARDTLLDSNATDICEHLAHMLLKDYDVERCEASLAICVDALAALARRWVSPLQTAESSSYSALMEVCETVYSHVTKIGFEKQVTSYTIRVSLANLLVCILQVNPEYHKGRKQSALDLFINALKDNDVRVKFSVSQRLHALFKIFKESMHLDLTERIEAALPTATTWTEGLAMRVLALGLVALASPSSISRVVFRIFETGQTSLESLRYTSRALMMVAKASGLESKRELFRMFRAKLIFTWTDYYTLDVFPYQVFGYDSIAELCEDASEELIAQVLVKGKDECAGFVASQLGRPLDKLLVQAFARITAYDFAWKSACSAAREGEPQKPSLVVRIQQRLGYDTYSELLSENFQHIISILMELMYEEGKSERLLSRDPNLADVYHVMKEITAEGYSDPKLAGPLQPHFKTRAILNAIGHACKMVENKDDKNIWTPAMVTFVARRLFDTLHPALGPAHTCGVIRNIRLLICLAGPKVHRGYQLQMLIHGLKPYVVDTSCAEDTVGILRYLFNNGRDYLAKNPSFVIGTFLSILTSMRKFERANLEVVQQDKQTSYTLSVVQSFRSWLAEYFTKFDFPTLNSKQKQAFQSMVVSAVGFRHSGNAVKNTQESELLRHLFDDDMSKDKLLDDMSRQLAFSLFCSNFTRPESFRDDIFGSDKESFERSKSLLRICRRADVNNGFLLWSARVLGRAYASTGQLHTEWMQEMEFDYPTDADFRDDMSHMIPKVGILRRLKALLFSDDKAIVRLIEASLAQIIEDKAVWNENIIQYFLTEDEHPALRRDQTAATGVPTPRPIAPFGDIQTPVDVWIKDVTTAMCTNMPDSPILKGLSQVLQKVDGLAEELFPYITHILLARNSEALRNDISMLFKRCFRNRDDKTVLRNTILIKTILYLRSQPQQGEKEKDRPKRERIWLNIDYLEAAKAACVCKMFKTALLFTEIFAQVLNHGKQTVEVPPDLLLEIFKNIDDPDSFYGVSQTFSLETVMNNFEYEGNGWKSLSLRAANLESGIRLGGTPEDQSLGIIDSFNTLGMNGLSHSFLQNGTFASKTSGKTLDNTYRSAWKLEQWDLPCPSSYNTRSASIYRALQTINNTIDTKPVPQHADPHFLGVMKQITAGTQTGHTLGEGMRTLAMLTEMEEVLISRDSHQLEEVWDRLQSRSKWMETGKYVDVEELMAMRQATFGSLAKRHHLRMRASIEVKEARYMEAKALVGCCKMARKHEVLQHALSAATQLNHIVQPCKDVGLDISGVATLQAANVLWEDGQGVPSIKMLLALEGDSNNASQTMAVGRAKLLAKLGSRISEARLEKPDVIMSQYLERAIMALDRNDSGSEAGRVFHEFASFCDQQLQNPNNIEDYERALKLKKDKEAEVHELAKLAKQASQSKEAKSALAREGAKARSWLALDEAEYNRLKNARDAFLEKSISNYLKCLAACDDYDGDAVRFTALWLANSEEERVNSAAIDLEKVPSRKLVPLMNQLSSRILSGKSEINDFQRLLLRLIVKICQEHPYHGLYQILALSKTPTKDEVSVARKQAALQVLSHLKGSRKSRDVVNALENTTRIYDKLAHAKVDTKDDKPTKTTLRILLGGSGGTSGFERDIPAAGIPPPTMHVQIRADCDYSELPRIRKFDPTVALASGLSKPKVIKCEASDGLIYKQVVKGGQDDLRQDAIMEQVFEQVSVLLQKGRITGQRNLSIRTYKVIPLTASSGIIEFVPNSIPLHDYLIPAHKAYFPKDWTQSTCRNKIQQAQQASRGTRLREYQKVTEHYHPVMHYFFMHEFNGPDAWYASRLAYTRSTAAISILGHVLGLGDRHGHNILLDKKTGEVVHIDLGVAFEQGRILPVPEVVPFRLTRDIVAGMGITKTEGVFRRCCEFTLEVLRNEAYSITTILDVLRYDPLYSWTMSTLRMKRMQDTHLEISVDSKRSVDGVEKPKKAESEAEADRALTVVAKKLSKTLSVSATVNELIQQASDERNLAVMWAGWAAYV